MVMIREVPLWKGAYCWQGPWGGAIDLGSGSAGLLAGELVGLLFAAN